MRILMIEDEKLFGDKIAGSLRREAVWGGYML